MSMKLLYKFGGTFYSHLCLYDNSVGCHAMKLKNAFGNYMKKKSPSLCGFIWVTWTDR